VQGHPVIEIETIVDNNANLRIVEIEHNPPNVDQEENNLNPIPVSNVENNEPQQEQQPPPRQR
jgi:hypothetical protein